EALRSVDEVDGYGPTFAAGALAALGATGLTKLVGGVRRRYEAMEEGLADADAALGALGTLLADAARTLTPVTTPTELDRTLANVGRGSPGYRLDLAILVT